MACSLSIAVCSRRSRDRGLQPEPKHAGYRARKNVVQSDAGAGSNSGQQSVLVGVRVPKHNPPRHNPPVGWGVGVVWKTDDNHKPWVTYATLPHWVPMLATHHVKPSSSRSDAGAPTTSVLNLKAGVIKVAPHSQGNELGKVSRGCVRVPAAGCCPLGGIVSCVREVGEGVLDSARPLTITSYHHAARNSGAYCAHTAWVGRGHCRVQH